jgi:hypothetical protein
VKEEEERTGEEEEVGGLDALGALSWAEFNSLASNFRFRFAIWPEKNNLSHIFTTTRHTTPLPNKLIDQPA